MVDSERERKEVAKSRIKGSMEEAEGRRKKKIYHD